VKTALADSRIRRIVLLAAVNLMLVVVGWFLLVSPQRRSADTASQKAKGVQSQLQRLAAATTPIAPKQPVIHTAPLYSLDHAMPVTEDVPDLLLAVDQVADAAGVQVTGLSPQTPAQAVGYTVLPISLTLSGTYGSITGFMHQLEDMVTVRKHALLASGRLFSFTQVAISPGTTGHKLTATLSVDAYVFGVVAGATPLPAVASTDTTGTSTTGTSTTSTTASG